MRHYEFEATKKVAKKKVAKKKVAKKKAPQSIGDGWRLHSDIMRYLDGDYMEDWRDQARAIMRFIREAGGEPITAKAPAPIRIDGSLFYLYRVQFKDLDGKVKWLAFESETGIADILNKEPNPKSYS